MPATARHVPRLRGYAADLPTPFDDAVKSTAPRWNGFVSARSRKAPAP
jgi:hypothetical protein